MEAARVDWCRFKLRKKGGRWRARCAKGRGAGDTEPDGNRCKTPTARAENRST
jgi:hypothetical protein